MSKKTLIRGVNWVGDAVMTMPAIRAIKRAYHSSEVSLLVKPWVAPLFQKDPFIDKTIQYEDSHSGIMGKFQLARVLREESFQRAILLQNALDAAVTAWLARIPERIGYARDGRGILLTHSLPHTGEDRNMHHIDYYLKLLESVGIPSAGTDTWIYLSLEERLQSRERLSSLKRPILGINPGASYGSAKQWLPERFTEVARRTIKELGGSVVVFGGPGEIDIASDIAKPLREHENAGRVMGLAGKTSLRELMALMSECDVVLSNDSGPMHIADALAVPLVAIFGSTSPELTGPRKPSSHVIRASVDCSPCFKRKCPDKGLTCMETIETNEVFEIIRKSLLSQKAVFFDRDGTLCEDAHYLNSWDKLKVFDNISHLNSLINKDYKLVGLSNQSGISRGIVDEGFVGEVNRMFMDKHGFSGFYYCPHHPDDACLCRKPEPGLAIRARDKHNIDLRRSYMVGDKDADMLLGRTIGAYTILVTTGKQKTSPYADFIAKGLKEAVEHITSQE
ncbi:lipopolysaccharide heptosyltransferase II [Nitrospirota bacterium]